MKRAKSEIVKQMLRAGGVSRDDAAKTLGFTTAYFNNKLHRNSFSVEDLSIIAHICESTLAIIDDTGKLYLKLTPENLFEPDSKELQNLVDLKELKIAEKRLEYEKAKETVKAFEEKYGFGADDI